MIDTDFIHVSSSNLFSVRWAGEPSALGRLWVRFHGGGTYVYFGVPHHIFRALLDAPSKGRFHWFAIRDQYPYRKI